ncbi:MAG: hypothetical protein HND57_12480 [Planctomycetes bacterium]|nr:hypothetical protein [Planctomycetota bacterium]
MPHFQCIVVILLACTVCGSSSLQAQTPPFVLRDTFGRDLAGHEIALLDWEGYIANPAIRLAITSGGGVHPKNYPVRIELAADGESLMFNLHSRMTAAGPRKTMFLESPDDTASFRMSVFPDRDSAHEVYRLTVTLIDAMQARVTSAYTIRIVDQDRKRPIEFPILIDFSHDQTGFFDNQTARDLTLQAAEDCAYFLDDPGYEPVAVGDEVAWIWNSDGFKEGREVTNSSPFTGFLLFAHGIDHEPLHSGSNASDRRDHCFQHINGVKQQLRRSGTISIETAGNWNRLGWRFGGPQDRDAWLSSNGNAVANDYYSIARHEIAHALTFHEGNTGYAQHRTGGQLANGAINGYLGAPAAVDVKEHFYDTIDPVSGFGVFGNEYGGDMPRVRWLITKFELLAMEAAGHTLRRTSPFVPLRMAGPTRVAIAAGVATAIHVTASGGIPAYHFELLQGRLPDGLTLDPFQGVLAGTPTEQGVFPLTLVVRDQDPAGRTATHGVTLVVSD